MCSTLCPTWRGLRHGSRAVRPPLPGPVHVAAVADRGGHGTDDGRLGLVDFGSSGRLDALEQALVADMLIAIRRRDRPSFATRCSRSPPSADRWTSAASSGLWHGSYPPLRSGSHSDRRHAHRTAPDFLALGIAMPPTTSLLFRTLAILEGTLRTLCPGYPSSHPPRTSPLNWYAGEREQRVASAGNHVTRQVMLLVCWHKRAARLRWSFRRALVHVLDEGQQLSSGHSPTPHPVLGACHRGPASRACRT